MRVDVTAFVYETARVKLIEQRPLSPWLGAETPRNIDEPVWGGDGDLPLLRICRQPGRRHCQNCQSQAHGVRDRGKQQAENDPHVKPPLILGTVANYRITGVWVCVRVRAGDGVDTDNGSQAGTLSAAGPLHTRSFFPLSCSKRTKTPSTHVFIIQRTSTAEGLFIFQNRVAKRQDRPPDHYTRTLRPHPGTTGHL